MKKYIKPEMFFESFELSQQIAACDFHSNNSATDEQCVFTGVHKFNPELGTITIFQNKCDEQGYFYAQDYCYHNAAPYTYGIFNS